MRVRASLTMVLLLGGGVLGLATTTEAQGTMGTAQVATFEWTEEPLVLPGTYTAAVTVRTVMPGGFGFCPCTPDTTTTIELMMAVPDNASVTQIDPPSYTIRWWAFEPMPTFDDEHVQEIYVEFQVADVPSGPVHFHPFAHTSSATGMADVRGLPFTVDFPLPPAPPEDIQPLVIERSPEPQLSEQAVPSLAPLVVVGLLGAAAMVVRRR